MKYLIIALLMVGTAYGQSWADTCIYCKQETARGGYIESVFKVKTNEQKLAEHWDNYVDSLKKKFDDELKSEMFVASLRTKKYSIEDEGDRVWIEFMEGGYPVAISIKRQKPTFEGFIEYLRGIK